MSGHALSFRGVIFFNSETGTGGTNGGASGELKVSPMVQEIIVKPFPLGIGYVLQSGNLGPAVHTFDGTWRTNDVSGTLALINSLRGLPTGTLTDTKWGGFPNCVLKDVSGDGEARKTADEWGYLVKWTLTFEQYP